MSSEKALKKALEFYDCNAETHADHSYPGFIRIDSLAELLDAWAESARREAEAERTAAQNRFEAMSELATDRGVENDVLKERVAELEREIEQWREKWNATLDREARWTERLQAAESALAASQARCRAYGDGKFCRAHGDEHLDCTDAMHKRDLAASQERIQLARLALVEHCGFKPAEVSDDVAPRIIEFATASQESERGLRKDLHKYGQHWPTCTYTDADEDGPATPCNCGLRAALASGAAQPAEKGEGQ